MWESGKREPSFDVIRKLSNFFQCSTNWLTGNSDFKTKEEWLQCLDDTIDLEQLQKDVAEADRLNKRVERDIAKRLETALAA